PATLLPKPIRHTIDERFEGVAVRQIERNRRGYEVELRNGLELKFNHSGKLLEVED
ncbi:MAG: PepSY-like domain-containing protein, partial [Alistipes sp.]|nr:PepSY-like domain-containing protein [Alistipes sp.]